MWVRELEGLAASGFMTVRPSAKKLRNVAIIGNTCSSPQMYEHSSFQYLLIDVASGEEQKKWSALPDDFRTLRCQAGHCAYTLGLNSRSLL